MTTKPSLAVTQSRLPFELSLRTLAIFLLLIAIGISGYLSYVKFRDTYIECAETVKVNCEAVINNGKYADIFGIPLAYLGLAANLVILSLILLENRLPFLQEYGVTLVFCLLLFAFAYSMYLIYVQAVILETYCLWCLGHEAVLTLLFIVYGLRLREAFGGEDEA
jgi:uncharacterized membrane protein